MKTSASQTHVPSVSFSVRTLDTAPAGSRPALERLKGSVRMIPNLAGLMANSPALIEGFVAGREAFQKTSFTPLEREVAALSNALELGCRYCAAIHATFASGAGLAAEDLARLRSGSEPRDARLAALARFTRALLRRRGQVEDADVRAFLAAGFAQEQILEVVLGNALSTIANFSGHLTHPEPDEAIRANYV